MFNFLFRFNRRRIVIASILVLIGLVQVHCGSAHATEFDPTQMLQNGQGGMQKLDQAGSKAKDDILGIVKILALIGAGIGLIMTLPFIGAQKTGKNWIIVSAFVFAGAYLFDVLANIFLGWFHS